MIRRGLAWFDAWVQRGDFRAADLGLYRIGYAVVVMLVFPDFEWLAQYPDSLFRAPLGPLQLLGGFPPYPVLVALELALALATVALLLGLHTRLASVVVAVLLVVGFGLWNSVGKIDHNMIMLLVPAVMAFSDWGRRFSVDSLRRPRPDGPVPQWPLRFLGLLVGLSFVTAARPKLYAGWLDPDTQAVHSTLFSNFHVEERQQWLAEAALQVPWTWVWEAVDWTTVLLEFGIIVALVSWRLFRPALAVACLFHLGVYLLMNIGFYPNIVAYGAFVLWGAVTVPTLPRAVTDVLRRHAYLVAAGLAGALWLLTTQGNAREVVAPVLVVAGGVAGACYLAWLAWRLVRHLADRGRTASRQDSDASV